MSDQPAQHKPWWKRTPLKVLMGTAVLLALIVAVGLEENWRSSRTWASYKKAREAEGEHFDLKDFALPPVPDDENFYKTPYLKSVGYGHTSVNINLAWPMAFHGEWTNCNLALAQQILRTNRDFVLTAGQTPAQDVMEAAQQLPEVFELRQAALRKYSQCDAMLDASDQTKVPNFVALRYLFQLFTVSASAELAAGQTDEAAADAHVIEQLMNALQGSPTLVSAMIAVAGSTCLLHVFWEGWREGKWSDAQLAQFQNCFASLNLVAEVDRSLHAEPVYAEDMFKRTTPASRANLARVSPTLSSPFIRLFGGSWLRLNFVAYRNLMRKDCYPCADPTNKVVFPQRYRTGFADTQRFMNSFSPFRMVAAIAMPNYQRAFETTAKNQAYANEAALVCALERYRHANGSYPATLGELAPGFIAAIPKDPINGQPFHYRLEQTNFLLYSIGWDETDDGGAPGTNDDLGDWVWRR